MMAVTLNELRESRRQQHRTQQALEKMMAVVTSVLNNTSIHPSSIVAPLMWLWLQMSQSMVVQCWVKGKRNIRSLPKTEQSAVSDH